MKDFGHWFNTAYNDLWEEDKKSDNLANPFVDNWRFHPSNFLNGMKELGLNMPKTMNTEKYLKEDIDKVWEAIISNLRKQEEPAIAELLKPF